MGRFCKTHIKERSLRELRDRLEVLTVLGRQDTDEGRRIEQELVKRQTRIPLKEDDRKM